MIQDNQKQCFIRRQSTPLPTESDFNPFGNDLDAQYAWQNFGNLSLKQAYDLFLTNPTHYQEDFMFMGKVAFNYYFPVIDRYIREITGDEEGDDCEVAILGSAIATQLDWEDADPNDALIDDIASLSEYVALNVEQYSPAAKDQRRIKREWQIVDQKLATHLKKRIR